MFPSQKLRPVAIPFVKLGKNCSALNLAIEPPLLNLLHDTTGSGNVCSPGQGMPNVLVMLCPLLKAIACQSFPAIGRFFF